MSNKRGIKQNRQIKWKESIGNNQHNMNLVEKCIASVSEILLMTTCALVFMFSARIMIEDVFGWGEIDAWSIVGVMLLAIVIGTLMEVASYTNKIIGNIIRWGILVLGTVFFVIYLLDTQNAREIVMGFRKMILQYMGGWNQYYGTNLTYGNDQMASIWWSTDVAINYITLLLFFVLIWMSRMIKKNSVMIIPAVIVLVAELMIGYSPEGLGIVLIFAGVLIANTSRWNDADFRLAHGKQKAFWWNIRYFSWIPVGICVFSICGLVTVVGSGAAEEAIEYSDDFKAEWNKILEKIYDWPMLSNTDIPGDGNIDGGVDSPIVGDDDSMTAELTNDSLEFANIPVLEMQVATRPVGNIYLKGFYADTYEDGVWERDLDAFAEASEDIGYSDIYMAEEIANLGVRKLAERYDVEKLADHEDGVRMTITYFQARGTKAYLPYFAEVNSSSVAVDGDFRYYKMRGVNKLTCTGWEHEGQYETQLLHFLKATKLDWEEEYEEYVMEHYVIDSYSQIINMPNVVKIAEEIDAMEYDGEAFYELYGSENEILLSKAKLVAQWMEKNTKYSISPPELPEGEDPIEYFLGTSRTGYCMHYASASVMILRAMGIPARYASGYIVDDRTFDMDGGMYKSTILDNQAHAWVEIYLDGMGWVPVEVTKGYSDSTSRGDEDETSTEQVTTKPGEKPQENTSEGETSTSTSTQATTDKETATQTGANQDDDSKSDSSNGSISTVVRVLLILAAIIIPVALVIYLLLRVKTKYREKLLKQISNNKRKRAIRMMNRRIYKKLRRTGKILKRDIRDEDYEGILKKIYPEVVEDDWKRFMDIAKAAAFSRKEFSEEEMEFCYEVYSKVIKNS